MVMKIERPTMEIIELIHTGDLEDIWYSTGEIADELGVHRDTARKWLNEMKREGLCFDDGVTNNPLQAPRYPRFSNRNEWNLTQTAIDDLYGIPEHEREKSEDEIKSIDIPDDINRMLYVLNTTDAHADVFTHPHIENLMKMYEGECIRFIDFEYPKTTCIGFCLNARRLRGQGYVDFQVTVTIDEDGDDYEEVKNDAVVTLTEKGREWVRGYKKFLRQFVASTEDKSEPAVPTQFLGQSDKPAGSRGQSDCEGSL